MDNGTGQTRKKHNEADHSNDRNAEPAVACEVYARAAVRENAAEESGDETFVGGGHEGQNSMQAPR
jgi:hypothetical protein